MKRRDRHRAVGSVYVLVAAAMALPAVVVLLPGNGMASPPVAVQEAATLPEEVTTWMARDQAQRWSAMIQTGSELFNEGSCFRCHGEGGSGGNWAPDLTDGEWVQGDGSLEMIGEVIFWGVRRRDFVDPTRRFQMNPSGGMDLDPDQLNALTAYVWTLSNGTFLPQR